MQLFLCLQINIHETLLINDEYSYNQLAYPIACKSRILYGLTCIEAINISRFEGFYLSEFVLLSLTHFYLFFAYTNVLRIYT